MKKGILIVFIVILLAGAVMAHHAPTFKTTPPSGDKSTVTKDTKPKPVPPVATLNGYSLHKNKDGQFTIVSASKKTVKLPTVSDGQAKMAFGFYTRGMLEVKDGEVQIPTGQVYDGSMKVEGVTTVLNSDGTIKSRTEDGATLTFKNHQTNQFSGTKFADVTTKDGTFTISEGKVLSSDGKHYVDTDGNIFTFSELAELAPLGAASPFTAVSDHGLSKSEISKLQKVADDASQAGETEGRLTGPRQPRGIQHIVGTINNFLSNEYGDLSGLGGLLLGDALAEWKAQVDEAFCNTVILGGKNCLVSKICETSPENAGGDGVLVSQTFDNTTLEIRFIAHIEGTRSRAAEFLNDTTGEFQNLFLYKTTYSIRNPNRREPNGYNVRFFFAGGSFDWFPTFQALEQAEVATAIGNNALVAYSTRFYTRVCLVFENTVEVNGQGTRQVCNTIVRQRGAPTSPFRQPPSGGTGTGAGDTSPSRDPGAGF